MEVVCYLVHFDCREGAIDGEYLGRVLTYFYLIFWKF